MTATIVGVGSYLPDHRLDVDEAARGYEREYERIVGAGYRTVSAEPELYPAEMALVAARRALAAARVEAADVSLLVVTNIHRHGHKRLWSPASWLQQKLGCLHAVPLSVSQGCNAQMLATDLALRALPSWSEPERPAAALVIAADRFTGSSFDRFTSDYNIVYGDGAGAAVIVDDPAGAVRRGWRIVATHTVADGALEGLHRDALPGVENDDSLASEHDIRAGKRRFLAEAGADDLQRRTRAAVRTIGARLAPEVDAGRLRRVVYPNLGHPLLTENYFPEFPGGEATSLWEFGRTVGHLGSGDQIVGLDHIESTEMPNAGAQVLLLGAGAGFTWTGVLLERTA